MLLKQSKTIDVDDVGRYYFYFLIIIIIAVVVKCQYWFAYPLEYTANNIPDACIFILHSDHCGVWYSHDRTNILKTLNINTSATLQYDLQMNVIFINT